MQKINIKKHTKEQMVKMLETAYEANESATAELERTAAQIHAQQEEIAALREKLKETKSAYDAAMDDEERRVRKLEEQGSELARANEELEKAKNESRELAKQLGERMVELKAAEENARKAAVEMNSIRAQLSEAEANAKRKEELLCAALHTIKTEKSIKEDYHKSLKWCMAHPWRNLWRCVKEHFRF